MLRKVRAALAALEEKAEARRRRRFYDRLYEMTVEERTARFRENLALVKPRGLGDGPWADGIE